MPDELDGVGACGLLVAVGKTAGFFGTGFLPKVAFGTAEEFGIFDIAACVGVDRLVGMAGDRVDDFHILGIKAKKLGDGKIVGAEEGYVDVDGLGGIISQSKEGMVERLGKGGAGKGIHDVVPFGNWRGREDADAFLAVDRGIGGGQIGACCHPQRWSSRWGRLLGRRGGG